MDKELQQLQAPKRSNETKQLSYNTIRVKIAQRKKRKNLHYYSVLAAAAILFILLTTSFFNNTELVNEQTATSPLTIEKGYATINESIVDLTYMTKWYYFDKNKVNDYDLAIVQPFITKLYASNVKLEQLPQTPYEQLLLVMSDGQVAQLTVLNDQVNNQYVLVDVNTKQALPITIDEAMDISLKIFNDKSLMAIVELFLTILLLIMYVTIILKISPKKKEKLELKRKRYFFFVGLGTYIVYTFVNGLSLYYFHTYNGLFIASVMTSLLLVKTLIEYYNGHFDRSILEVPVFFLFVLLYTFVKFL